MNEQNCRIKLGKSIIGVCSAPVLMPLEDPRYLVAEVRRIMVHGSALRRELGLPNHGTTLLNTLSALDGFDVIAPTSAEVLWTNCRVLQAKTLLMQPDGSILIADGVALGLQSPLVEAQVLADNSPSEPPEEPSV